MFKDIEVRYNKQFHTQIIIKTRESSLMTRDCIFCNFSSARKIAENENAFASQDDYPVTKFHTLIIPKRHTVDYFDLTQDEVISCDVLIRKLMKLNP